MTQVYLLETLFTSNYLTRFVLRWQMNVNFMLDAYIFCYFYFINSRASVVFPSAIVVATATRMNSQVVRGTNRASENLLEKLVAKACE